LSTMYSENVNNFFSLTRSSPRGPFWSRSFHHAWCRCQFHQHFTRAFFIFSQQFGFVTFWRKDNSTKPARKILMKLTTVGCTINDMWDKNIDAKVARTRTRYKTSSEIYSTLNLSQIELFTLYSQRIFE